MSQDCLYDHLSMPHELCLGQHTLSVLNDGSIDLAAPDDSSDGVSIVLHLDRDEVYRLFASLRECFLPEERGMCMNTSPMSAVARIRRSIAAEYRAAEQGLSGLASGVSQHAVITAHAERISRLHQELIGLVGPEEAIVVLAESIWTTQERTQTPASDQ